MNEQQSRKNENREGTSFLPCCVSLMYNLEEYAGRRMGT